MFEENGEGTIETKTRENFRSRGTRVIYFDLNG